MFNYQERLHKFFQGLDLTDALKYGIFISPSTVEPGNPYWRVIGVYHLPGSENVGKQNLFMDCVNEHGEVVRPSRILWGWEGQRPTEHPSPVILDKPFNEPGGNIGIYWGQRVWAKPDGFPAEEVKNVHTMHPDEGLGATLGHHSFYIAWQLSTAILEPPPTEPPPTSEDRLPEFLTRLEALIEEFDV